MGKNSDATPLLYAVLDSCERLLESQGVPCVRSGFNLLEFTVQQRPFTLSIVGRHGNVARLATSIDCEEFPSSYRQLLNAVVSTNARVKVVKVYIDVDYQLVVCTETHLNEMVNYANQLARHMLAVNSGVDFLKEELQKSQHSKGEAQD